MARTAGAVAGALGGVGEEEDEEMKLSFEDDEDGFDEVGSPHPHQAPEHQAPVAQAPAQIQGRAAGRRRSRVDLVSLQHGFGRPSLSLSDEMSAPVRCLVECFGAREVSTVVRDWIDAGERLRDVLAEVFDRLAVRRQAGLRGMLLVALAYEAVVTEIVSSVQRDDVDLVDRLVDEVQAHVLWLSRQDTDVLLRLSLASSDTTATAEAERLKYSGVLAGDRSGRRRLPGPPSGRRRQQQRQLPKRRSGLFSSSSSQDGGKTSSSSSFGSRRDPPEGEGSGGSPRLRHHHSRRNLSRFYSSQSRELMQKLVATRIFRTMVEARYVEGPFYFVVLEMFLYSILCVCYSLSILVQRNASLFGGARLFSSVGLSWALFAVALPIVHYFTIRIQFQMQFLATFEQTVKVERKRQLERELDTLQDEEEDQGDEEAPADPDDPPPPYTRYATTASDAPDAAADKAAAVSRSTPRTTRDLKKATSCAVLCLRCFQAFAVVLGWFLHRVVTCLGIVVYVVLIFFFVALASKRVRPGREEAVRYYLGRTWSWFVSPPDLRSVFALSGGGQSGGQSGGGGFVVVISKHWRNDPLNWVELAYILICWVWLVTSLRYCLVRTYDKGKPQFNRRSADVINVGTLLMWVRILGFLREYRNLAPFVILLTKTVFHDLKVFFAILGILYCGFAHTLYNSIILNKGFVEEHSPNDGNAGLSELGSVLNAVYTYVLTGETTAEAKLRTVDNMYVVLISFAMLVVVLNVLIALVIESYEDAMARATQLFWHSRFEQVAKTIGLHGDLAKKDVPRSTIEAILNEELADACHDALFSSHLHKKKRRVN